MAMEQGQYSGGEPDQDEQIWGNSLLGRIFACVPGVVILFWLVISEGDRADLWPAAIIVLLGIVGVFRRSVRITRSELIIRNPIGTRKVPRAEVESARFTSFGLRVTLRDGSSRFALLSPGPRSKELSSGASPEKGGAAYEITQWAGRTAAGDSDASEETGG